jgi:hypothetical protein
MLHSLFYCPFPTKLEVNEFNPMLVQLSSTFHLHHLSFIIFEDFLDHVTFANSPQHSTFTILASSSFSFFRYPRLQSMSTTLPVVIHSSVETSTTSATLSGVIPYPHTVALKNSSSCVRMDSLSYKACQKDSGFC